MSIHRAVLVAVTALFIAATTSAASAGCCYRGHSWSHGYAATGCGGCGSHAAVVYAPPLRRVWHCGCRAPIIYTAPEVVPTPIAPAPIYVVDQGPDYTGPGIMVPYRTWSLPQGYVVARPHTYIRHYGYGHGYYHHWHARRLAYRAHFYGHPHHHQP